VCTHAKEWFASLELSVLPCTSVNVFKEKMGSVD
jgi:hypothetical protein